MIVVRQHNNHIHAVPSLDLSTVLLSIIINRDRVQARDMPGGAGGGGGGGGGGKGYTLNGKGGEQMLHCYISDGETRTCT